MARSKKAKTKAVKPVKKGASKSVVKKVKKPAKIAKKLVKKSKKVLAQPKGYHNATPYLVVNDAEKALTFYQKAFGAKQTVRINRPDGKIAHAEFKIGDSKFMLGEPCPVKGGKTPKDCGGSPMSIYLYVKNVDATLKACESVGGKIIRPAENMFYGDRNAMIEDISGYSWCIATHVEDVTPAQLKKRAAALFGNKK